jgi:hypothetical protein
MLNLNFCKDFDQYISEDTKILIPFCLWIAMDMAMVAFAAILVSYGEVSLVNKQNKTRRSIVNFKL